MKLLTFLGTGVYAETEYALGEQRHITRYAPAASCAFLKPDELIVFATPEAQAAHGEALQSAAQTSTRFVPIVLGRNIDELWEKFGKVASSVSAEEQAAFDVTHGLRSFPLLGLLAAAFLRSARRVDLQAVLYGAFDVRDQTLTPNRTPMFDLTPMLSLLEWATATDRFLRFGDGRDLAALLRAAKEKAVRISGFDREVIDKMGGLDSVAGNLETTALALRLTRVNEAMESAAKIPKSLERARPALEAAAAIRPFSLLANEIQRALQPLAFDSPNDPTQVVQTLMTQRQMIVWYVEKQQLVQAITLAREWLVSWAMAHLGQTALLDKDLRETVTTTLNSEARRWRELSDKQQFRPLWFTSVAQLPQALAVWNELADTRNDIDHAGMRAQPLSANDLARRVRDQCARLEALNLPAL